MVWGEEQGEGVHYRGWQGAEEEHLILNHDGKPYLKKVFLGRGWRDR